MMPFLLKHIMLCCGAILLIIYLFQFHAGGGNIKIESRKLDIKAASRIDAKNDKYAPQGGEKKVIFAYEP